MSSKSKTVQNEFLPKKAEIAILASLKKPSQSSWEVEQSLNELEQLAITAGGKPVERFVQERESPHPRTYIGPGKAEKIAELARDIDADLVIIDGNLSASQQHNLEKTVPAKVIDRTALILDIFAQRAHSSEGKLQVELAQLTYLLPRLTGRGVELSRLGGGIGTRGPGETKLEVDRRRIARRITHLRKELKHVAKVRATQHKKRRQSPTFTISLVGYTNAGKSTLLNTLTNAHVHVEDKLFATLDSTARRLKLSHHQPIVLSDTVGFIRQLPHQLIAAFRSTLDEVRQADLLLHVIDANHPQMEEQMEAVEQVLKEIGASGQDRINVLNKTDLLSKQTVANLSRRFPQSAFISAREVKGLDKLLSKVEQKLREGLTKMHLIIPFDRGEVVESIYRQAKVIQEKHTAQGTDIIALVPKTEEGKFKMFKQGRKTKKRASKPN